MTRAAAEARPTADLLSFIADDRAVVSYRPRWNQLTGSITATILLQQLIYRWVQSGRRPFYKFTGPCAHPLCRPGDSWEEELGLTRDDLVGPLSYVGGHGQFDEEWAELFVAELRSIDSIRFADGEVVGLYVCPCAEATRLLGQSYIPVTGALKVSLALLPTP